MKLVISLATRGRPKQLLETIKRDLACLSLPETRLMVQIDDDDEATVGVTETLLRLDDRVHLCSKRREDTIAAKWNRALEVPADVYMVTGDDDPWMAPDSDRKILEAASLFPDGIGFVHGRMANASFSGIIGMTRKMADILGYLQPEHFPYWFCDHWTTDLGKMTARIVYADVWTDRSSVGRTMEMREPGWWATWFDAAYLLRRREAERILGNLDWGRDPAYHRWQAQMLRTTWPAIEYYSRFVNDQVRQMRVPGLPQETRYERQKQRAIEMLPQLFAGMDGKEQEHYASLLFPPQTITNLRRA